MSMEMLEIRRSEVTSLEKLHRGRLSSILRAVVRGQDCVLKVVTYDDTFRSRMAAGEGPYPEKIVFQLEKAAYKRLAERGLCARGVVPRFYGCIEKILPQNWKPHLDTFMDEKVPLDAILIEYIPDLREIDLTTYSKDRMVKVVSILRDIHNVGIRHGDTYPRNVMVAGEDPNRVVWIDFDRAATYTADLTAKQRYLMDEETELIDYFVAALADDYVAGKIDRTRRYYYE